jgi:Carboxypeptidase regulatory-like domain
MFAFVVSCAMSAVAQNSNSGEIKGEVTDATGAVVGGTSVTLLDTATGVSTKTETNGVGIYDVPSLPIGPYTITFSKTGFRDEVRSGIILPVATVAVDATLQLGAASQQVVVTADVPLLQTEDSAQHLDLNTQAVLNAPVVGGVWYNELTNVLPGVNGGGSQDASGQGVGVNGTEGYSGTFLIEGALAQEPRDANASDNYPPIDAIGEANVQTSNFGAQYGNGVAAFNVLLKSGTNRFHGSLFEFNQNNDYDARNYFNPAPGPIAPLHWNEFGGSVGGPIVRNKLFFYFTYQRNPNTSSGVYTTTVPTTGTNGTTNMLSGCFPLTVNTSTGPASAVIDNPSTGTPYPNNCINSPMDPVALAIQKYFPAPNQAGTDPYVNNYKVIQTTPTTSTWYVGKVDYDISKNNRLSGSYLDFPIGPLTYNVDPFCSRGFDCTLGNNYNMDGQISDAWTISSHLVNEAQISGVREFDKYIPPTYGKGYPTTIGLEPTYGNDAPANIFPTVQVDSSAAIGGVGINGGVHALLADGAYVESDVLTLIKGRNTIKMGGEFDKSYQNYTSWGDVSSGNFVFDGVASGQPYADFLLGEVYGWYVYDYVETGARMWNMGAFVQDDFKLNPKLTLNLGLRYQYQGGWGEVHNLWGTFSPSVVNTGQYAPAGSLGAMTYGGQGGRTKIQNGDNQWVPRVGMSWAAIPHWVFRASYGISDQPWSVDPYSAAYGIGLNPHGSEGYGSSPVFLLKNGPGPGAVAYPSLSNLTNSQYNYDDVSYYPENRQSAYYQEYLLSVQRELPFQSLIDTSYVHTKGTHLGFTRDIDQNPASKMTGTTSCYSGINEYPLFCSIAAALFDGYSNYDALQLRLEKRTSFGLYGLFNYSWSKSLDTGTGSGNNATADVWQNAFNIRANYGLSKLEMANSITGSVSYELPFGAGKQFELHGVADEVLGGWRGTGIFQIHSGIPFTVTTATPSGADASGSGANQCGCGYAWLPNVVGSPSVFNRSVNEWFNNAAFATPASGTFGDEHRNTLLGPNWRDLDLSLGKTFIFVEGIRFEIRADMFNAFNHPNFSQPNSAAGAGVAQITSTASGARQIQLGGRLTF